jgi:hypothetical protein
MSALPCVGSQVLFQISNSVWAFDPYVESQAQEVFAGLCVAVLY